MVTPVVVAGPYVFYQGTMPVMLEVSCIISAAAGDWPDFFVILAMVLAAQLFSCLLSSFHASG